MPDNTITFTKPTIAVITVVVLVLAAFAFWYDRGESDAIASSEISSSVKSNTYRNDIQDTRITAVEKDTKSNKEEIHKEQLARAEMIGTVNSTAAEVTEIRQAQQSFMVFLMQFDYEMKRKNDGSDEKEDGTPKKKAGYSQNKEESDTQG